VQNFAHAKQSEVLNMKYVYPAILYSDDGAISVKVPDLPGCFTFGHDKAEALLMARDAVEMWLWDAENNQEPIPPASDSLNIATGETFTLIAADTDEYRQANDTIAVKKTLSIPSWLNYKAEKANAPFSQILQQGLKEYLHIAQ
jgi:predicted RNase H-like HicB family nuclease